MDKLQLDTDKLYSKTFEITSNGYSPKEVDAFLDLIIEDYETINSIEEYYNTQNVALQKTNSILRNKVEDLQMQLEMSRGTNMRLSENSSNAELIKKIAQLEGELHETKLQLEEAKN